MTQIDWDAVHRLAEMVDDGIDQFHTHEVENICRRVLVSILPLANARIEREPVRARRDGGGQN